MTISKSVQERARQARIKELKNLIDTMNLAMANVYDDEEYRLKDNRLQEWIDELVKLEKK